jgi:hypothetical protein
MLPRTIGRDSPTIETGPTFFTKVLLEEGLKDNFTLFPRAWFYPYGPFEDELAKGECPEAYAIHRWEHSWLPGEQSFRRKLSRKIHRVVQALR